MALLLLGGVGACKSPCNELADKICNCEPTTAAQDACKQRAETTANQQDITDADQQRCDDLLGSCSCDALAAGNLAACGLAKETESSAP